MQIINKDILTVDRGIICQQVNCRRVMGSGLAKAIREKWPKVYEEYRLYENNTLGATQIIHLKDDLYLANLFGQADFGTDKRHTQYGALAFAIEQAAYFAHAKRLDLYLPYGIGCGLGGGDWEVVSQLINFVAPNGTICHYEK